MKSFDAKLKSLELSTTQDEIDRASEKIEANKKYRYHVCAFPSLYGTPVCTNSLIMAHMIAFYRALRGEGTVEIYDEKLKKIIRW